MTRLYTMARFTLPARADEPLPPEPRHCLLCGAVTGRDLVSSSGLCPRCCEATEGRFGAYLRSLSPAELRHIDSRADGTSLFDLARVEAAQPDIL